MLEQGYAFQVSVSMPSPTAATTTLIQTSHHTIPNGGQNETITLLPGVSKHNSSTLNSHSGRGTPPQQANAHYPHQQSSGSNNILPGNTPSPGISHMQITQVSNVGFGRLFEIF